MDNEQEITGTQDYQNVITATQKAFDIDRETAKEVIGLELETLGKQPNKISTGDLYSIIKNVVDVFCQGNGGSSEATNQMYLQLSYLRQKPSHITEYNSRTSPLTS